MSLTGRLYKISGEALKEILQKGNYAFDSFLKDFVELSYFAIDYLEILSMYSGFERKIAGNILQGNHFVKVKDGYLGYAKAKDVSEIKLSILDKIDIKDFVRYVEKVNKKITH